MVPVPGIEKKYCFYFDFKEKMFFYFYFSVQLEIVDDDIGRTLLVAVGGLEPLTMGRRGKCSTTVLPLLAALAKLRTIGVYKDNSYDRGSLTGKRQS
jgi:hypothetical protein